MSHSPSALTLWFATAGGSPSTVVASAASISADGIPGAAHAPAAAAVVLAQRRACYAGVLVVGAGAAVRRNDLPCVPGLHPLRHADRLQVGDGVLWVSADLDAAPQPYDPVEHGDDQFCQRTKARLTAGESIVICPGTPREYCGAKFKAAAWALRLPCHACGHDPRARRWRPQPASRWALAAGRTSRV